MNYCTHLASLATGFSSKASAELLSCLGWLPARLPKSAHRHGTYGLQNANGDWIRDIHNWWSHDARAELSFFEKLHKRRKGRKP
jgi:hypothetical protein